jgi:hypothetical protein
MATLSPEFRIILDKINYSGASVGSEWIFDFDFKIASGRQTFDLKQAISRKVSFNKNQTDINRTLVRADFDPSTKNVAISGKLKASEEGSNEKYSESGSGTIQMQSVNYDGTDVVQTLTASGIKVKEYKGPKYKDDKLATAILDFEFKVIIQGASDNACDFQTITEPEVASYRNLTNANIEALQTAGDLAGATTPGNFALGCCIFQNEKKEYRAKITKADAAVLWGIHTLRYKDPIVSGPGANITNCQTADIAIQTMEKSLSTGGVESLPPKLEPWFPEIGLEAHELTHVADYEKLFKSEFTKIKKELDNLKVNLPQGATDEQIKMMQDTLAMQYADKWRMNCITQITTSGFLATSEANAQKAAMPILSRAIQTVKDWKKANCK